jgi:hypothetical protein
MKHIKTYEDDNSQYKKWIITQVKSDKFSDIYTNLYENIYTQNTFICRYYLDQNTNIITKLNGTETRYINTDGIIYQTDELSEALEYLTLLTTSNKYNL